MPSARKRKLLQPGKAHKTRRSRDDVQIKYRDPDGKVITAANMKEFLRSMMHGEARPFTHLAEDTAKFGGIKSPGTLSKLYYGNVHHPSLNTQVSVMRLYGYEMVIREKAHSRHFGKS